MYAWPVLLPAQTNREDFLRTVSLFDDDTGQALDLSGRTLGQPGDFTGNNWQVTDGTINVFSGSVLTIKDYPFGAEMQAIALTVFPLPAAILAGDRITIADIIHPKNSMTGTVVSYAPATGAIVCQVGVAFLFEIRGNRDGDAGFDSYGSSSLIGSDDFSSPIIAAQLGSGISVVDLGKLQIRIPAATIAKLRHRTYGVAMTMFDGADTRQLLLGRQPILSGGVTLMPLITPASSNPFGLP